MGFTLQTHKWSSPCVVSSQAPVRTSTPVCIQQPGKQGHHKGVEPSAPYPVSPGLIDGEDQEQHWQRPEQCQLSWPFCHQQTGGLFCVTTIMEVHSVSICTLWLLPSLCSLWPWVVRRLSVPATTHLSLCLGPRGNIALGWRLLAQVVGQANSPCSLSLLPAAGLLNLWGAGRRWWGSCPKCQWPLHSCTLQPASC